MINRNWLQVKRAIFKSAREVYVLADSSKFGVGYVSVICPANLLKDLGKKSEVISFCPQIPSPYLIHLLQPQFTGFVCSSLNELNSKFLLHFVEKTHIVELEE